MSHPSKDIISSKGRELAGRKIALLVTSSVASFKAPEIARELMRHGADVYAVISPSTEKMIGAEVIEPEVSERKAKIASTENIVRSVIARLSSSQSRDLEGRRVLVTAGPTIEHIDPVRVVTNRSSGKMGVAIAEEVASRGADTTLILGHGTVNPPSGIKTIRVESTSQLLEAVLEQLKRIAPDLVFAAGAPTDYRPVTVAPKKIRTREKPQINLELRATPKILEEIRRASPKTFLVAFKTEHNVSNEELIDEAFKIIHEKNADLVAATDVGLEGLGFQADTNEL